MLLDTGCSLCGRPGPAPCAECRAALQPAGPVPPPLGLEACVALVRFEGAGRRLVADLKYRNQRAPLDWLALGMVATLDRAEATGLGFDVVTWAPTVRRRVRRRGFDQARLLARAVARELGVSARRLLVRVDGPSQTGRSRLARLAGPRFRPVGRPRGRVLLVDDVITTGATLSAAAEVLLASGSGAVVGLVAARTVLKCGPPTAETSGSHR